MDVLYACVCPFTHWWVGGLFSHFGYSEKCCHEHRCTIFFFECLFSILEFLGHVAIICLTLRNHQTSNSVLHLQFQGGLITRQLEAVGLLQPNPRQGSKGLFSRNTEPSLFQHKLTGRALNSFPCCSTSHNMNWLGRNTFLPPRHPWFSIMLHTLSEIGEKNKS